MGILRLSCARGERLVKQCPGEALLFRRPALRVGVEALPALVGRAGAGLDVVVEGAGAVESMALPETNDNGDPTATKKSIMIKDCKLEVAMALVLLEDCVF